MRVRSRPECGRTPRLAVTRFLLGGVRGGCMAGDFGRSAAAATQVGGTRERVSAAASPCVARGGGLREEAAGVNAAL